MPDYFGLPDGGDRQQWFGYTGTALAVPWVKPRGISVIHFWALAGGGGGGGGFTGATSTNRFGGGGGAAGGTGTLIIPAAFLPDRLWVIAGAGGAGGPAGTIGSAGTASGVMLDNAEAIGTAAITVMTAPVPGQPGGAGTSSAVGGGGAASAVTTLPGTGGFYGYMGSWTSGPGQAGGTGALAMSGSQNVTTGGAAGGEATSGNTDNAGGALTATAAWPVLPFTLAGGAVLGGNGLNGVTQYKPLFFTGGTGGGSYAAGTGGTGGNGATGCGGGGGGGGITGGPGGNGGAGLVIITCW
jgi:hypothetical protein